MSESIHSISHPDRVGNDDAGGGSVSGVSDPPPLRRRKSALDSKGVIGAGMSSAAFAALVAVLLTKSTGVEVSVDEVEKFTDDVAFIVSQWPAWLALFGSLVALLGNWRRKARIAWLGKGGKRPWKSRGVWGNLLAIVAGGWTFVQAVAVDANELAAWVSLAGEHWMIVTPAVVGVLKSALSLWGRLRATAAVSGEVPNADEEEIDFGGAV